MRRRTFIASAWTLMALVLAACSSVALAGELSDEDLADLFVQSIDFAEDGGVVKWHEPVRLEMWFVRFPKTPVVIDDAGKGIERIVGLAIDDLRQLTGHDISRTRADGNLRLSVHAKRRNPERVLAGTSSWAKRNVNDPEVSRYWIYAGLSAIKARDGAIEKGSCAATYHFIREYQTDLTVRQMRATGVSKEEIARGYRELLKSSHGRNGFDWNTLDRRAQEIVVAGSKQHWRFPTSSECVWADYLQRWRMIVDACLAETLGLHSRWAYSKADDVPHEITMDTLITEQLHWSQTTPAMERYRRLFLSILYSKDMADAKTASDAKQIALNKISTDRATFDASYDKRESSCVALP